MPTSLRPSVPGAARRGRRACGLPGRQGSATGVRPAPAVLLTALVAALLVAAPASAHARFTGSDPAEGSQLAELPAAVVLSYSEEVAPQFVETALVAPDGAVLPTTASAAGVDVTVDLGGEEVAAAADQPGTWQVVARVVSVDGHPVEHTTAFVLVPDPAAPSTPAPAGSAAPVPGTEEPATVEALPAPEPSTDPTSPATGTVASPTDGLPRWAVVVGAVVLALAAAAALLVQLRRRPPAG